MHGDLAAWNKVQPHGYVPGEVIGNVAVATHLFLASIILVCGPLQLIPQIREHVPTFHRWNGRLYLPAVVAVSVVGLNMTWFRGSPGRVVQHVGISLDAILIPTLAALTLRHAMARDIRSHRRWALRLFLVVSGVWFFRVGLMPCIFVNNGAAGFDAKTFTGPFLDFWAFADYLLPLAILEIYLRVKDRASAAGHLVMAAGLVALTVAMGVGIFAATIGFWLPNL